MYHIFKDKHSRYYSLYSIFSCMAFETPIFLIYMQQRGLEYSTISFLFSLNAVAVFIFEYLTGLLSDRYSRKLILLISTISFAVAEILFLIGFNIAFFITGIIFMSLSVAARSGADVAYIYDKLNEVKGENTFNKLMSNLGSITIIITALVTILGPVMAKSNMRIPFLATIICSLISLIFIFKFEDNKLHTIETTTKEILLKSFKAIHNDKQLLKFIIISIIIFPCYHVIWWLIQPYLQFSKIGSEFYGVFYVLLVIFESIGTKYTERLIQKFQPHKIIFCACMLISCSFLIMFFDSSITIYLVPVLSGLGFGLYYTSNTILINEKIESDIRASFLSLQHALTKISQFVIFTAFGFLLEKMSITYIFMIISIYVFLAILIIYIKIKTPVKNAN